MVIGIIIGVLIGIPIGAKLYKKFLLAYLHGEFERIEKMMKEEGGQ